MLESLARTAAALGAVASVVLAWIAFAPLPRYALQPVAFDVTQAAAADVAEGRRLALMMCAGCHTIRRRAR